MAARVAGFGFGPGKRQPQAARQDLLYCSAQGLGCCRVGRKLGVRRPNKSFKPKPLRYANHMAGRACHVLRSTTRLGLTWVLGLVSRTVVAGFQAICSASLVRSVCTSHARCRHQQSALQHLGFGPARLFARFDLPVRLRTVCGESSWPRAGCVSAAPSTALVVLFASGVGLPHVGRRCQGTAA